MFDYIPPPLDDESEGLSLRTVIVASVIGLILWAGILYGISATLEAFGW